MAWIYTVDQIVKKVKKKKRRTTPKVFVKRTQEGTLVPGAAVFIYQVGVKLGWRRLVVHEWRKSFENYVPGIDGKSRLQTDDELARGGANALREKLEQRGIECGVV